MGAGNCSLSFAFQTNTRSPAGREVCVEQRNTALVVTAGSIIIRTAVIKRLLTFMYTFSIWPEH